MYRLSWDSDTYLSSASKVCGNLNQIFYLPFLDRQLNGYFFILEALLTFAPHFLMHSMLLHKNFQFA